MDGAKPMLVMHVFPTFAVGGAQVRFAAVANRLGPAFRHLVVSLDGRTGCIERIDPPVPLTCVSPAFPGTSIVARLLAIRALLRRHRPALLVTSNWGSIEWATASRTIPGLRHVHTEDGFGPDEALGQKSRRVLARRLVLRGSTVVLPSMTLMHSARAVWRLPERCLSYIPNGLDLDRFGPDGPDPGCTIPGEGPVVGTVARLRPEKNIARLLRACALLRAEGLALRVLVVGDGPDQAGLEQLAGALGLGGAILFAGHVPEPSASYRAMDIFALSSDTEQMPFSLLEAMASRLPIVATDVGDVRAMAGEAQAWHVVACDDRALAEALRPLVMDPALRARLGEMNRARAVAAFDAEVMYQAYARLWRGNEPAMVPVRQ